MVPLLITLSTLLLSRLYSIASTNDTYTWRWATKDDLGLKATATLPYSTELTYGKDVTVEYAKYIKGISSRDSEYSALLSDLMKSHWKLRSPLGIQCQR